MFFASLSQHIRTSGASKTAQRHFNCNDPSEPIFNFCSALSSQFEVSNNQMCRQASAHCRSSGRESPQSGRGHGKGRAMVSTHWPGFGCLCVSSFPGTQSRVKTWWTCWGEVAHTDTTVCRASHCRTVLYRTVVVGFPTGRQTHSRQGPHGARCSHEDKPAVGYSSRLTKGIMVISKYFWSLYKLSLLWWHFLSWNLEPKALSSWSAEDSQIAKYLVMD